MKRALIVICLFLGACSEIKTATDNAGRDAATTVMPETLALYFPQVPKAFFEPFTHCVVEFATANEVQTLAADALVGADQGTADVVTGILARPETQDCLRAKIGDAQMAEAFVQ